MKKHWFVFLLLYILSTVSCTVQKRTVNKGYFVQWDWQKHSVERTLKADLPQPDEAIEISTSSVSQQHGDHVETPEPLNPQHVTDQQSIQSEGSTPAADEQNCSPPVFAKTVAMQFQRTLSDPEEKEEPKKPHRTLRTLTISGFVVSALLILLGNILPYTILIGIGLYLLLVVFIFLLVLLNKTKESRKSKDILAKLKTRAWFNFVLFAVFFLSGLVLVFVSTSAFLGVLLFCPGLVLLLMGLIHLIQSIAYIKRSKELKNDLPRKKSRVQSWRAVLLTGILFGVFILLFANFLFFPPGFIILTGILIMLLTLIYAFSLKKRLASKL